METDLTKEQREESECSVWEEKPWKKSLEGNVVDNLQKDPGSRLRISHVNHGGANEGLRREITENILGMQRMGWPDMAIKISCPTGIQAELSRIPDISWNHSSQTYIFMSMWLKYTFQLWSACSPLRIFHSLLMNNLSWTHLVSFIWRS